MYTKLSEVDKSKVTNEVIKDYIRFKNKYRDALIFIQIGSFFETFFEDAFDFSQLAGVSLASRTFKDFGEVQQAGIPQNSLNIYIKKVLNSNRKVCVCDQYLTKNGTYKRKIRRVYTKGTILESEFLDSGENNYVTALYFKEGLGYLAYADISTGQFYKTKGNLNAIIQEVDKISPSEVLIAQKQKDIFKSILENYNTTLLPVNYFNTEKIEDAILKYCNHTQLGCVPSFDEIVEYNTASTMFIDPITKQNLEILRTKRYKKKEGTLFSFLNDTKTAMGTRLLKKFLSEPLLIPELIIKRQEAVKEIISKKDLIEKADNILQSFIDLSRVCTGISNSTILPKDMLLIVKNSNELVEFKEISSNFKSDFIKIDSSKLEAIIYLSNKINNAISSSATNDIKTGGIFKSGYNPRLDYYRDELKKVLNELSSYENSERERFGIKKIKIDYSRLIGYYIEFPVGKKNFIPQTYIKKQTLTNCIRCTNEQLGIFEQKILNLKYKINELEFELYSRLKEEVIEFVQIIRDLAKEIARFDVILSFAKCAIKNNFVCPKFNTENNLEIKNGYHPCLIQLDKELVKNDTSIKSGQMIILTGANMCGKSTYIKHNAIICFLAQIGSFVPAGYASCSITDKIFMCQDTNDDISNNNSSFMVEMDDFKFILDNATSSSIVLLDEPAKSTTPEEGSAIAKAYLEYLLKYNSPKIFVVTHNLDITKLESRYPDKIFNYMMGTNFTEQMIIDRKIRRGVSKRSFAINTARLANLPTEIIRNAKIYMINEYKKYTK